jgi:predicted ester cyclase
MTQGGNGMSEILARALDLWARPLPEGCDPLAAFNTVYTDPLVVNGLKTPLAVLVERARLLQTALANLQHEIMAQVNAPAGIAFALRLVGDHIGPLATPRGLLAATGNQLELTIIDIFQIENDRVTAVWSLADYPALFPQAKPPPQAAPTIQITPASFTTNQACL